MGVYSLHRKDTITLITFNKEDEVTCPYEDPLVVTLRVEPCDVFLILVDTGSSVDLLFFSHSSIWECMRKTSLK